MRVLLFGGIAATTILSDTWEWDGTNWIPKSPAASPAARYDHAIAWDAARGFAVLFGGAGFSQRFSDTWEWDGSNWLLRAPSVSPGPRYQHAMANDLWRRRILLVGGNAASPFPIADTWEWTGSTWLARYPTGTPRARQGHALAFDSRRGRTVMFGGGLSAGGAYADFWLYGPTNPASYASVGPGCPGSAGTPLLGTAPGQLPWLGEAFALDLSSLPPGNSALVWFGSSRTAWGPINLPLDLGSFGMQGCALRVSPDSFAAVFNLNGRGSVPVDVPDDPALLGASFYNQAFVVDRAANPLGAIVSNAAEGKIGAK